MNEDRTGDDDVELPQYPPGQQPMGLTAILLTLLTAVLWGGTPVSIRYSLTTLPPVFVAGARFALAAAFMVFWCLYKGEGFGVRAGQRWKVVGLGVVLFFQIVTFNLGIAMTNASHGSLFINTFIFGVAAIEHLTGAHRLNVWRSLGLLLAGVGVALIMRVDQINYQGDLVLLLSAFILAVKILLTKRLTRTVEPGPLIFWHDVVGVILFFTWSALMEQVEPSDFTPAAIWGLLYQGVVVAGFCFGLQAVLLERHPASQVSVISFTTPLFGVAFAVAILGENVSPYLFLSAIFVALGIWLVNRER